MAVANENIKFSDLYTIINGTTHNNESISLSDFRGEGSVPTSGAISINSHFKGQTFQKSTTIEYLKEIFTDNALNKMYSALIGGAGTMYNINNDMRYNVNYISDGGNDMYDGGNKISFNSYSNILTYTNTITSNPVGNGKYFIKIGPSATNRFFLFFADVDSLITNVQINGNNGADNQGTANTGNLTITKYGIEYKVFWKTVHDGQVRDPAINHIWIVKNEGTPSASAASNTDNDYHVLNINSSINRVYFIMWAGATNDMGAQTITITAVVNKFLDIVHDYATIEDLKQQYHDAALNKMYTALTAGGGTMYNITNDMRYGVNSITDGGSDIYDGGNKISFNSNSGYLTYTNTITSNPVGNGKYFIKIGPSATNRFFLFFADVDSLNTNVQINGNNGADGSGYRTIGDLTVTKSDSEYRVFWKSVHDGWTPGDPAINHIWIVSNNGTLSASSSGDTNNDYHILNINSSINRVYFIMWAGLRDDGHTNETEVKAVVNKFFDIQGKLYEFTSHSFTNCSATGKNGPTLANCTAAYSGTSWSNNTDYFNMTTQGYQKWTVPISGNYRIQCHGARSGTSTWGTAGYGRIMQADFNLVKGTKLVIIVGQEGQNGGAFGGGGGGGTFVLIENASSPLIVAGGGGGAGSWAETQINPSYQDGTHAVIGNNGTDSKPMGPGSYGIAIGSGGTGGNGGQTGESHAPGAGGGGWLTDGTEGYFTGGGGYGKKGFGYPNGLIGGDGYGSGGIGGFGGGAGTSLGGGGGGGYSGGGGGTWTSGSTADYGHGGGGGGSYVASSGTDNNFNQYNTGMGTCHITLL